MAIHYALPDATAQIRGDSAHPDLRGRVVFLPQKDEVLVIAEISGLPESDSGFFGFHIHEGDSCEGQGFLETGNHYNPESREHPAHAGDLPPLLSVNGNAYMAVLTARFQIPEIIGCSVVIHSQSDDFRTQPSGNAGTKIACGVIEWA